MRVLVTGSSGHIGGAVIRRLFDEGHELTALSRSTDPLLPTEIRQLSRDIRQPGLADWIQEEIRGFDAVVHCAASQQNDTTELMEANYFATRQLLDATLTLGASSFIYMGSMSYLKHPLQLPVTETHLLDMTNAYSASKYLGEWMVLDGGRKLSTVSLRPSSPVGPGLKYRRIFRLFVEKAMKGEEIVLHGEGGRRQDYVDVRDIASAVSATLHRRSGRGSQVYNIAAGVSVSNLDLARCCIEALHSSSTITFSGVPDPEEETVWEISIRKAEERLGYKPQYCLEDSILDLAAELKN
jgi:nucleoside-diphosphate-sugar epimerase